MIIYREIAKDDPVLYAQFVKIKDEIDSMNAKLEQVSKWLAEIQQTKND